MRIPKRQWDLRPSSFRLAATIQTSRAAWTDRAGLLLSYQDAGHRGVGEASPLPSYSSESLAEAEVELSRLVDANPTLCADGDPLAQAGELIEELGVTTPSARFAVETAVLDWVAQCRAVPAWRLLRSSPSKDPIEVNAVLTCRETDAAIRQLEAFIEAGYRSCKIKVGVEDASTERALVAALLRRVGGDFLFRLDANRAWSSDTAFEYLGELDLSRVEYVEEPLADPDDLTRKPLPCRVALDESLQTTNAKDVLAELGAQGMKPVAILKPTAIGGYQRCLELADLAHRDGGAAAVTHTFEGAVGLAAAVHLTFALASPPLTCGLASDYLAEPPAWLTGSRIAAPSAPGLGA